MKTMQTDYQDFIIEIAGDILMVKINFDRVTLKEVKDFRELLNEKFAEGNKKIIADLTESVYCDSTFMGALVVCSKKIAANNGKYVVITIEDSYIHNLFKTTGLDRALKLFYNVESAVEYLC